MRFGMARYDSVKFWEFAQKQVKEHGYSEKAWAGEREFIDENGETVKQAIPTPEWWPTLISKEEFTSLHRMPKRKAHEWHRIVARKMTDHIRYRMLTEDGVGFAYGFSNYRGRSYCSLTVMLAALQSTGLELQPHKDRWNLIAKALKAVGAEAAADIRTDLRIIAPAGFMWQPIVSVNETVDYPDMTYQERMRAGLSPRILEDNPKTTQILVQMMKELDPNSERMAAYESALGETIQVAMQGEVTKAGKRESTRVSSGSSSSQGFIDRCANLVRTKR